MAWKTRKKTTLKSHEGKREARFGNIKCFYDGSPYFHMPGTKIPVGVYDSQLEARYHREILEPLRRAGKIAKIERQIRLPLHAGNGVCVCKYKVDFVVTLPNGQQELHEVKGAWTEMARLKVKWCALEYDLKPIIRTKHDF